MTTQKLHQYSSFKQCSKTAILERTYQVRPYYEGSEKLNILWVCPECGEYEFQEFDEFREELEKLK